MMICTAMIAMKSFWGEIIASTSDEEFTHTWLIRIGLAGEILVAVGILLEIERPLNLKKILSFAAVIMGVILSAAGTLLLLKFDEGISHLQKDKIITLERRLAPREIFAAQETAMVNALFPFAAKNAVVFLPLNIVQPDMLTLANAIARLKEFRRIVDDNQSTDTSSYYGVRVDVDRRAGCSPDAGVALIRALNAIDIFAYEYGYTGDKRPEDPCSATDVFVGVRP